MNPGFPNVTIRLRAGVLTPGLGCVQVECSIYGIRPPPEGASAAEANGAATCQPGSGYLVLPCMGSQLQFYDVAKDRHISRLAVVPRNVISATETTPGTLPF